MMTERLNATLARRFDDDDLAGRKPTTMALSSAGVVTLVASETDEETTYDMGGGWIRRRATWDTPAPVLLRDVWPGRGPLVRTEPLDIVPTHVAKLPDGYLIASSRCRENGAQTIPNGVFVDHAGRVTGRILLGDGLQTLVVGPEGGIWVGYMDEGIYGANGWSEDDTPDNLGADGVVRFSRDGTSRPAERASRSPAAYIDDVYAMTVADGHVWVRAYVPFSVHRFGAEPKLWEADAPDLNQAMAVSGTEILLADLARLGREPECTYVPHLRVQRVRLAGDHQQVLTPPQTVLGPDGGPLRSLQVCTAGRDVVVRTEDALFVVDRWWEVAAGPCAHGEPQDPLSAALPSALGSRLTLVDKASQPRAFKQIHERFSASQHARLTEAGIVRFLQALVDDCEGRRDAIVGDQEVWMYALHGSGRDALSFGLRTDLQDWDLFVHGPWVPTERLEDVARHLLDHHAVWDPTSGYGDAPEPPPTPLWRRKL